MAYDMNSGYNSNPGYSHAVKSNSLHYQMLKDQESGLEDLAVIVARQKAMAIGMNTELDEHNEIIGDIADKIETANSAIFKNTRNVRTILKKDRLSCCYWFIIVGLFIAIVVISFVF